MVSRAGMMVLGADKGEVAAIMANKALSSWSA